MVHFKAKSIGLKGLDKDSLPKGKDIFPKLYLLLPLIVLVFMVIQSGTFTMRTAPLSPAWWPSWPAWPTGKLVPRSL